MFLSYSFDRDSEMELEETGSAMWKLLLHSSALLYVHCHQRRVELPEIRHNHVNVKLAVFLEHTIPQFSKLKQEEENLLKWIVASCSVI